MEEHEDAEFNILAFAILYEKVRGKESFFYPVLACTDKSYSMLYWNRQEIYVKIIYNFEGT